MYYIYYTFSVAGWIALGVFLLFWAMVALVRAMRQRRQAKRDVRGFEVMDSPIEHHEEQP